MKVAVVIPCYKVKKHILSVLGSIGEEVCSIYVVDDCCPEFTGEHVLENCKDDRVIVIKHETNLGVGGAVLSGYRRAIQDGAKVIVKLDGDGQMDSRLIKSFIAPILAGKADYTKGNRFFDIEAVRSMPKIRIFGNAMLSFMAKVSSGYWNIFDPTNGFTAIHAGVARFLPFEKLSKRYFFETDMLFRLNTLRAVVVDIPMAAKYGDEVSNLKVRKIVFEFLLKHIRNATKRVFYNYYLRDMSISSLELPFGISLIVFGLVFGLTEWTMSIQAGTSTAPGTVMLAAMPIILGLQLILAFLSYDISAVPQQPVHQSLDSLAVELDNE